MLESHRLVIEFSHRIVKGGEYYDLCRQSAKRENLKLSGYF